MDATQHFAGVLACHLGDRLVAKMAQHVASLERYSLDVGWHARRLNPRGSPEQVDDISQDGERSVDTVAKSGAAKRSSVGWD